MIILSTRAAKVWGQASWTPPGGATSTYQLSNDVLGRFGATLSNDFELSYTKGDGYNCTEH